MSQTLEATEWIGGPSGRLTRRSALPDSHWQSWPSLWQKKFGEPMPNYLREELGLSVLPVVICPKCKHEFTSEAKNEGQL